MVLGVIHVYDSMVYNLKDQMWKCQLEMMNCCLLSIHAPDVTYHELEYNPLYT